MIKNEKRFFIKCFGILLFVLFGFGINFGDCYTLTENCYCDNPSNCNNTKMACIDLDLGESFSFTDVNGDTFYSTIDNTINFETNENLYVFTRFYGFNGSNRYDNRYYSYFNEDGYINTLHSAYKNSSPIGAFFYSGLHYVFVEDTTDNQNFHIVGTVNRYNRLYTGTVEEAKQILSSANIIGRRILPYGNNITSFSQMGICLMLDNDKAICSRFLGSNTNGFGYTNANAYPTGTGINLGYSIDKDNITVEYLQNNFGLSESPFTISNKSSSTVMYTNTDLDKVISYYETRYNRNESMCYVGTFDTGSSYGTPGIDFVSGTGNSVFGLYHELYNGYGNNIIKNVGSWINVRLINYSERFYNNDNIRYLANYNGPDTNISLYYTGLTFPFANKPVALYFMASNLYDGYSRESSQGEEMSYYCYSKLNYQQINDGDIDFYTIKQMVSTGINERLDIYYNYHIANNSGSYITPSSGSFRDSFGTGFEDTDLDLDTTFSNFFDKITSVFQNYSPDYSTGIIPDWILYPLIFLILFRIMKH